MKTTLGIIFGGQSVEHEVSILSAHQAINAIDKDKFEIFPIYICKQGNWYTGKELLILDSYKNIDRLLIRCTRVMPCGENGLLYIWRNPPTRLGKNLITRIDVVLLTTHGTHVEDGCLQGLLETYNVPYTGCNVAASAIGMDKIRLKEVSTAHGIPVVNYIWFFSKSWNIESDYIRQNILSTIGYPMIVKPADLGSSIGVSVVSNEGDLDEAISLATSFTDRVLIEKLVPNVLEINCSVLGDSDEATASVCEEPLLNPELNSEFLSYADKYQTKGSAPKGMEAAKRRIPADISDELSKAIQKLARKTFSAIGASGVARIVFSREALL